MIVSFAALLCTISISGKLKAEPDDERYKGPRSDMVFQFPVFEYPSNVRNGYSFPSMSQSLSITKNTSQIVHSLLAFSAESINMTYQGCLTMVFIGTFDILYLYLPLGYGWMHEEWHRAVLSHRGINSYNEIYNFNLFSESISVSHVKDENLARLKAAHPKDMVRLAAAGNESEVELVLAMKKDCFFTGRPVYYDMFSWWMNTISAVAYLDTCANGRKADSFTDKANEKDGDSITKRDALGLDFTAWVYDLFRPNEPYESRGVHPSGVGIDRYIKYSELTDEEKKYLKLQRNLSFLNFLSPQMFGIDRFTSTNPFFREIFFWNFAIAHHLTSFGYAIDANIFLYQNKYNLSLTYHNYMNKDHYFAGIEASLARYPLEIFTNSLTLSCSLALWLQPNEQKFTTARPSPGGMLRIGLALPVINNLEWFIQSEGKTEGWVAGMVYLEKAIQVSTGINWIL